MSTSGITFGGLASGLDTQAIIGALLAVERRPLLQLEEKKETLQDQVRLFGDFRSRLESLRDAVDDVRQSVNLLEFKAGTDRDDYLTASAGNGAIAGAYDLTVVQLAGAQSNQSASYTSDTTSVVSGGGAAALQFTVDGNTFNVPLPNAQNSLQDIATAINGVGESVSAQVIKVDDNDFRLVVTGETGEDKAFTAFGVGSASAISFGLTLDSNQMQAAQDAQLNINGLVINRSSNSISDAITGVTLNLTGAGGPTKLTVTPDASATGDKVKKFVDAYNAVVDFVEAQGVVDEEGEASSPLFGDSTLRTVRSTLRSIAGSDGLTSNSSYTLLSQIGIDADQNGKLTFTQSEFDAAVAADEDAVVELFSSSDTFTPQGSTTAVPKGIALRLYNTVDDYLDNVDGLLISRTNGFNSRIADADRQIERAERRLEDTQASLELRFANLEILLSRLQGQGASLGAIAQPG